MKRVLLLLIALMPLAMMAEQRTANEAQAVAASYLNAITRLPVGVYIVVADAKCQKVLVR